MSSEKTVQVMIEGPTLCTSLPVVDTTNDSFDSSGIGNNSRKRNSDGINNDISLKPLDAAIQRREEARQYNPTKCYLILAHHRAYANANNNATNVGRAYRKYEVVEREEFLDRYCAQPPGTYHAEEVLTGPCAIYLDLEYATQYNRTADGVLAVERIVQALYDRLEDQYEIDEQDCSTTVLYSSKASKFSAHVIIQMDQNETAFADASHCFAFIWSAYQTLLEEEDALAGTLPSSVLVHNEDGSRTKPIFDVAVYSHRQNYRLYGSSKLHDPSRVLRLATEDVHSVLLRDVLEDSLISSVVGTLHKPPCRLLRATDEQRESAPLRGAAATSRTKLSLSSASSLRRSSSVSPAMIHQTPPLSSGVVQPFTDMHASAVALARREYAPPNSVREIARAIDVIRIAGPTSYTYDDESCTMLVATHQRNCPIRA